MRKGEGGRKGGGRGGEGTDDGKVSGREDRGDLGRDERVHVVVLLPWLGRRVQVEPSACPTPKAIESQDPQDDAGREG